MPLNINTLKFAISVGTLGYNIANLFQLIHFLDLRANDDSAFIEPYSQYLNVHIRGTGCDITNYGSRVSCPPLSQEQGRTLVHDASKYVESIVMPVDTRLKAAASGAVLGASFAFFTNRLQQDFGQENQPLNQNQRFV